MKTDLVFRNSNTIPTTVEPIPPLWLPPISSQVHLVARGLLLLQVLLLLLLLLLLILLLHLLFFLSDCPAEPAGRSARGPRTNLQLWFANLERIFRNQMIIFGLMAPSHAAIKRQNSSGGIKVMISNGKSALRGPKQGVLAHGSPSLSLPN